MGFKLFSQSTRSSLLPSLSNPPAFRFQISIAWLSRGKRREGRKPNAICNWLCSSSQVLSITTVQNNCGSCPSEQPDSIPALDGKSWVLVLPDHVLFFSSHFLGTSEPTDAQQLRFRYSVSSHCSPRGADLFLKHQWCNASRWCNASQLLEGLVCCLGTWTKGDLLRFIFGKEGW